MARWVGEVGRCVAVFLRGERCLWVGLWGRMEGVCFLRVTLDCLSVAGLLSLDFIPEVSL